MAEDTRGNLRTFVERLGLEVSVLTARLDELKAEREASAPTTKVVASTTRTVPTDGDPVDLRMLAEWVDGLLIRYGAEGDWLKPCWWRHGLVVEELAALRVAWLAVYDGTSVSDASEGLKWHEQAEKCRQRIRKTISVGTGCSAGTHREEDPITNDPRWGKELTELGFRPRAERHSTEEDLEPEVPAPAAPAPGLTLD
jgi:hypothetical protein